MIALLLDREFNHSQKCLEVLIREKFDSRNIWRIQYIRSLYTVEPRYKEVGYNKTLL